MHGFVIYSIFLLITGFSKQCVSDDTTKKFVIRNNTSDFCPTHIEFDAFDTNKYITYEDRYKLCKDNFPKDYDTDNHIRHNLMSCLGPNCNYTVNGGRNPCIVECLFKDRIARPFYVANDNCSYHNCNNLKMDYIYDQRYIYITDPNQKCGPDQYCSTSGCCVEHENPTSTTQTPKTTTSKDRLASTTPRRSATTTTLRPTPQPNLTCNSVGQFKYPNDATNRKYYRCVLKSVEMVCANGQLFEPDLHVCKVAKTTTQTTPSTVTKVTPTTPTVTSRSSQTTESTTATTSGPDIDYHKYLKCDKEGYFRNPYNCSLFYWCYKMAHTKTLQLSLFQCKKGMIFDDTMGNESTCILEDEFITKFHFHCVNKPLPGQRVTYLHCQKEGIFSNPYKCGLFYRCSRSADSSLHLREFSCIDDMVFDDQSHQCIEPDQYARKFGSCEDKPSPDQ